MLRVVMVKFVTGSPRVRSGVKPPQPPRAPSDLSALGCRVRNTGGCRVCGKPADRVPLGDDVKLLK